MDMRARVKLPSKWIERSRAAAVQMIEDWAHPTTMGDAMSATLSSHGAEKDAVLLGRSKMAECVVCLWGDLDPETGVKWRHADGGLDIIWSSLCIEVKHSSHPEPHYLIWPYKKRHLFERKQFDIFILVSGIEPVFTLFGWTTKQYFAENHLVAGPDHPALTENTWYLTTDKLRDMTELQESAEATRAGYPYGFVGYDDAGRLLHFCHCGKSAGFGYGVSLRKGQLGEWYCAEHDPCQRLQRYRDGSTAGS